jgi:hypothetical protein
MECIVISKHGGLNLSAYDAGYNVYLLMMRWRQLKMACVAYHLNKTWRGATRESKWKVAGAWTRVSQTLKHCLLLALRLGQ